MTPTLRRWLEDVARRFELSALPGSACALPDATQEILSILARSWDDGAGRLIVAGAPTAARPSRPSFSSFAALAQGWPEGSFWILNDVHAASRPLWDLARELLESLGVGRTRLRPSPAGIDLVLGHYALTPFGVHRDVGSNIMWCLHGERVLRLWDDPSLDTAPPVDDLRGVDHHLRPGDALYWPASAWHVGQSPRGFSVALNLSLWLHDGFADFVARAASGLAEGHEHTVKDDLAGPGTTCPAELEEALSSWTSRLRQATRERWLAHATSLGLGARPLVPLVAGRMLRGVGGRLHIVEDADGLVCGGNGHAQHVPFHRGLLGVLRALSTGASVDLDHAVATIIGSDDPADAVDINEDDARALLALLEGWGLVVRNP